MKEAQFSVESPQAARRVLYISYAFPPVGGAGVQRTAKFTKYLPRYGWLPTVLTVANPSVPVTDQDLLRDIASTKVLRAKTWEPGYRFKRRWIAATAGTGAGRERWLKAFLSRQGRALLGRAARLVLHPDPQVLWNPAAFRQAMRILRDQEHRAIFVTGPPFSSFLLGRRLQRRSGLPLVLDFRDEWLLSQQHLENLRGSGRIETRHRKQMHSVLSAAAAVIATTDASAAELERCCREAGSGARIVRIYNGFDPDDFDRLSFGAKQTQAWESSSATAQPAHATAQPRKQSERVRFRLVYTGTLWNLTDVSALVDAVRCLADRPGGLDRDLELCFVGRRTPAQDRELDRLGSTHALVRRMDYLPHDQSLRMAADADALCLLLADRSGAERVVPAKLFEYLALRRPIVALLPEGEAYRLLSSHRQVCLFLPSASESIAAGLADLIRHHRAASACGDLPRHVTRSCVVEAAELHPYSRVTLTQQLAELLDRVLVPVTPDVTVVTPSSHTSSAAKGD